MAPEDLLPDSSAPDDTGFGIGLPPVEDASEPEHPVDEITTEDAAEEVILDHEARTLPDQGEPALSAVDFRPSAAEDEDASDVAYLPDVPVMTSTSSRERRKGDFEHELSAHAVAVELRRIEADIRTILEDRDPKRKRKLSGTHRWQELEDDILSWFGSGRFDDATLGQLRNLVNRRHYLFRHLNFLASTRPTWNS